MQAAFIPVFKFKDLEHESKCPVANEWVRDGTLWQYYIDNKK